MGCDIHCYVDYDVENDGGTFTRFFATPDIDRDYSLFGLLAGVRDRRLIDQALPVKGVPERLSWYTRNHYHLTVTEDEDLWNESGFCSPAQAEGWTEYGCSVWIDRESKYPLISHPDWHTASWCTADELEKQIEIYEGFYKTLPPDFDWSSFDPAEDLDQYRTAPCRVGEKVYATLAAMRALEERGHTVRLVFWFDN